jgi:2-oxoglutarate dehydrogenase E2 component (dihydrolipoamide succinyltransferase)
VGRTGSSGKFYSPLVRNIAQSEGVSLTELETLAGSGQGGRVTKKDILDYLPQRVGASAPAAAPAAAPQPVSAPAPLPLAAPNAKPAAPKLVPGPGDEIIEMDRMRKLIADHMVMSKSTSPHVTSFVEADVTNLVLWRDKVKGAFEKREGEKLTFTPIFIMAIAQAIKEMPMINVQVDGYTIIRKKEINIGMAAALPSGNLIVPVIRNADQLNLVGLARKVNDLAKRSREGKLLPDEISGGTYTVTNVGTFGNVLGTPVINQPQVAIMATGAIRKKPAVIETPSGDLIGIRQLMFLSHSYDHRVVDGALGGRFVRRVADILEGWSMDQEF